MYSLNPDPPTLSLKEVSAKFEQWRSSRTKQGKIPHALWQEALTLLDKYSIGKLTKVLRISSNQIKTKMKQYSINANVKTNRKLNDFVAINIPQVAEQLEPHAPIKIEIKRPDGAMLIIEHLNTKIFTEILTQFMEGLKC